MKKKNERDALVEEIRLQKRKQEFELQELRAQFQLTYESIKPVNLIKNTLRQVAASSEIRNNILHSVIGLATGYLAKKFLLGASHNPVKKILGTVFQFAIASIITKRSKSVPSIEKAAAVNHSA